MGSSPPPAVSLPIVLSETGLLEPHIQGFFCNDTTIQYPRMAHYIIEDSALMKMSFFISIFTVRGWPLSPQAVVTGYERVHPFFWHSGNPHGL